MGWESSMGGLEALLVQPRGAGLVLFLASMSCMVGRSPQQPPLVKKDAEFFPTPRTLGFSSPWLTLVYRVLWGHWWAGSLDSDPPPSQKGSLPGTPPHQRRRGTTSLPPLTPSCSRLAGVPPSSRWINLLCPMLEGPGICNHVLLGNFSNIPACID